jgi:deoxyribodipyrimidine photo-lyase
VRALNELPLQPGRRWVLYWMTSFRRATSNFALDRALEHAQALGKPLVVLEALRVGYPYASDRLHAFVLEGMGENARRFEGRAVTYLPYVEPKPGAGSGLMEALSREACVTVTDDWPSFFVPKMQAAFAARADARVEAVDSNGLVPMHHTARVFTTAHSFRAHLQKVLPAHLAHFPHEAPLEGLTLPRARLPTGLLERWPLATPAQLSATPAALAALPIDHTVPRASLHGGAQQGEARLQRFVTRKLANYPEQRNEPEVEGTSLLSPYLHFGHVSAHQVFHAVTRHERWSLDRLGRSIGGSKEGWWQLSPAAEAFVDQFVTWRELAFNLASHRPHDCTTLDALPTWARQTMTPHRSDVRPHRYTRAQLEAGRTHDALWNATQQQLVRDGWSHNYLRMLWGKKLYEWSSGPEEALETMATFMGRYSLDGRDPVSWSGYLWVLGLYDRPWGPERPIFGKLRYMSSDNTAKKLHVKNFIAKYAPRG